MRQFGRRPVEEREETHSIVSPFFALLAHPSRTDASSNEAYNAANACRRRGRLSERAGKKSERQRFESVQ
jgi:hypothetical protein